MSIQTPQQRLEFVLSLAQNSVPWALIAQALELCQEAGGLPLTEDPLPVLLLEPHQHLVHEAEFVRYWEEKAPGALWQRGKNGTNALEKALTIMLQRNRFAGGVIWAEAAPVEAINQAKVQCPNRGIVGMTELLLAEDVRAQAYYTNKERKTAGDVVLEKGAAFPPGRRYGQPWGTLISTPRQWEELLKRGNPDEEFTTEMMGEERTIRLWEWLKVRGPDSVQKAVSEWAAVHRTQELGAHLETRYWQELSRHSTGTRQDTAEKMRAHPKWFTLRDQDGRNPLMLAISKNETMHQEMKAARLAPVLAERDNLGRSIVFYALSEPSKLSAEKAKFLAKIPGVMDPSPVTGRGLIMDKALKNGAWLHMPKWDAAKVLLEHSSGESWWAMSEEEDRQFGEMFWNHMHLPERPKPGYSSFGALGEDLQILFRIAERFPDALGPYSRGVACACAALIEGRYGFDSAAAKKLEFAQGAKMIPLGTLSAKRQEEWQKAMDPERLSALESLISQTQLEAAVAPGAASTRPRM